VRSFFFVRRGRGARADGVLRHGGARADEQGERK
jgi:hypothetical protein